MSMTYDKAKAKTIGLLELISYPLTSSIFATHPNDLGAMQVEGSHAVPPEWHGWWQWSGEREDNWKTLVEMANYIGTYNESGVDDGDQEDAGNRRLTQGGLPENLARLLVKAKALALPRKLDPMLKRQSESLVISSFGMSPKKYHEVSQMASYLLELLDDLREQHGVEVRHIVDIGAGQGHLSRSLSQNRNLHVLALDSSQNHAEGFSRKYERSNSKGKLTRRTCWLGEMPVFESHPGLQGSSSQERRNLKEVVDEWLYSFGIEDQPDVGVRVRKPTPVVFVALHACGSLTPFIMRDLLDSRRGHSAEENEWFVAAAIVVGCCYNLMGKADFPLSRIVRKYMGERLPTLDLTPSHLQLAAQVPSEWFKSKEASAETELSMKKILYRALITPLLTKFDGLDAPRRLGKLNKRAYQNFETYLNLMGDKLERDLPAAFKEVINQNPSASEAISLSRRIRFLHALRCLLGPPVESLIILDRYLWLHEELGDDKDLKVELINLFDQETGSGRNVGVVLAPSRSSL